jgi:hypothetical protein
MDKSGIPASSCFCSRRAPPLGDVVDDGACEKDGKNFNDPSLRHLCTCIHLFVSLSSAPTMHA